MGLREWTNQHPKVVSTLAGACVAVCVGGVVVEVLGNRRSINATVPDDFYSIDDGKSFFRASGSNVAPFEYEGQTAVRAAVFECSGHEFVGYLDRYKPAARQVILAGKGIPAWVDVKGREVKRPGDANWVSGDNAKEVDRVTTVTCPGNPGQTPDPVLP